MKNTLRKFAALAAALTAGLGTVNAQTVTWIGAVDTDWNTAGNWDLEGVPTVPAEGHFALIGAGVTVVYNAPMAATSIWSLTNNGILNINASGFNADASGNGAIRVSGATARLFVNAGGAVNSVNGGFTIDGNATASLDVGTTLTVGGAIRIGDAGGSTLLGGLTNLGGILTASSVTLNPGNSASTSQTAPAARLIILGGTNDLGAVVVQRSPSASGGYGNVPLGSEGLVISNGLVRMTSFDVGGPSGNSWLSSLVGGGVVTNSGDMIVRAITAGRASRFLQTGGLFVSQGAGGVNLRGHGANNAVVIYSVLGGTNLIEGFALGTPGGTDITGTIRLTNAAKIYIGSGGITSQGTLNTKTIALNAGGTFGAQADWSGTEPILLSGGVFDSASLDGTPRNINLSGVLSGPSPLTKVGGGTLTLDAVNNYSGNTLINAGTLALGAAGAIASSPQILVAAGATFDVSAAVGYTVGAARILGGDGLVVGDVAVASGGIINPGNSPGVLTLNNALTLTGDGILHFDLPAAPGPGNDRLIINGDLNASGVNTIEIVGGGSPGTVHALIQYGGNFNGSVANFDLTGASGTLSNNASLKTIFLVVESAVRLPGDVVWVGNALVNDWDTVNRTNWKNTATSQLDYFVTGDTARFDATGAAHPIVNLVGNNTPAAVTVDAAANYTFSGGGAISGAATLIKTNSGTLTITTANTYTGPTIIGGGVLAASSLADAGSPSSIGSAAVDSSNLVFAGGALRYLGADQAINRGASVEVGGGIIDVADADADLTFSGQWVGPGALTKTGAGTLVLSGANTHQAGTLISAGTFQVNNATAAGTGGITNVNATLRFGASVGINNPVHFDGNTVIDLNNPTGDPLLRGAWSGNGAVLVTNLQNAARTFTVGGSGSGGGNMVDFSGTLNMGDSIGFLRFNDGGGNQNLGSPTATFDLGSGAAVMLVRNGGVTIELGELRGGSSTTLRGRASGNSGNVTYSIGAKNTSSTFAGTIANSTVAGNLTAITKVGTGKLTLTGVSTYTSDTTINDGTLQVDGALGNTPVTVNAGTLAGSGSIEGSVTVNFGATLAPGSAGIGTMTLSGFLSLGGNLVVEVNKGVGHDQIIVNGGVTFGGDLTVQNVGGALQAGDTFQIFSTAGFGDFTSINGSPGPGLSWSFDPNTGVLSVVGEGESLNVVQTGNNLEFSWSDPTFKLQAQTNSLNTGLSGNWGDYPGGNTSPVNVTIDPAQATVFFRLIQEAPAAAAAAE
jgi:fibronectin-binding autotransporter adhesin